MARLKLMEKIPGLKKVGVLVKYSKYLDEAGFKIDAFVWILVAVIIAVLAGIVAAIILPEYLLFGAVAAIVVADLVIAYPYILAVGRIDKIEAALPDVLKQMSNTLRAGGTYEYTLREIAEAEFGPLKKEINKVLRKLEEGENFENSFNTLSENIDSRLVKRTVAIIVDSIKAGAGLADILEDIADDVRSIYRLGRERKARTMMQVMFMVAAAGVVAPAIFGFVSSVVRYFIGVVTKVVEEEVKLKAIEAASTIQLGVEVYLFVMAFATAAMMSLMREGRLSKTIIYFPILLFIGYTIYIVTQAMALAMLGGA